MVAGMAGSRGSQDAAAAQGAREERLRTLYERWEQFAKEYGAARARNDQEVMTNLRGLMLVIKRQISKLGGQLPEFPYPDEPHLADL
jgi:tRNA C32,U32 (ribose-2'-O)-methylase TrmJ